MDELVNTIAGKAGLDPATAAKAVGIVLAFLRKEAPPEPVARLFEAMPGAATLADQAGGSSGGLMGALGGMMGGGLMALAGQLTSAGLGMDQMQVLGHELFAAGRQAAGEDTMGEIVGAVPGLSQFV